MDYGDILIFCGIASFLSFSAIGRPPALKVSTGIRPSLELCQMTDAESLSLFL